MPCRTVGNFHYKSASTTVRQRWQGRCCNRRAAGGVAITPTTVIRRTYYGVDCALLFFFLCSFRPFTFSFIYNFDFLLCLWLSRNDESSPSRVELKVAVWLHLNYCIKEKSLSTAISAAQREEEVGGGGRWRWSSPPGIAIK